MRTLQFIFCFLACLAFAAAAMVALLWSVWLAFIPAFLVIVFGILVLVTEKKRRQAENEHAPPGALPERETQDRQ